MRDSKEDLLNRGLFRIQRFCAVNDIPCPRVTNCPSSKWDVSACAYYRPDTESNREWMSKLDGQHPGINICPAKCAYPCLEEESRNWSWPGSVTDRTPYGVLAHELGHHCDWLTGKRKGRYFSEVCEEVMKDSGEPGLTSYADENPSEWFAEAFRLYVTNPSLLSYIRPTTCKILMKRWKPIGYTTHWLDVLKAQEREQTLPERVVRTLRNKGAR